MTSAVTLPAGKQVQSRLEIGSASVCLCLRVFCVCVCVVPSVCRSYSLSEPLWSEREKVMERKRRKRERGDYILSFALPANLSPLLLPSHSTCQECSL